MLAGYIKDREKKTTSRSSQTGPKKFQMVSLFSKELPFKAKAVFFCKGDVTTSLLVGFSFPTLQRLHRFIWMGLVTICYISTLEALGKCCLTWFDFFLVNKPCHKVFFLTLPELWTQERQGSAPRIAHLLPGHRLLVMIEKPD